MKIDTQGTELPVELEGLLELLSEHVHNGWMDEKVRQGWIHGTELDEGSKRHSSMVPYSDLSEEQKELDRRTVRETLKAILSLGYEVIAPDVSKANCPCNQAITTLY